MRHKFLASVGFATSTTLLLPAFTGSADAAVAHEHWGAELVVCNHSGYEYGVYADGPSARQTDLGGFDECRHWQVRPGRYDIGFRRRITSDEQVIEPARVQRGPSTFYEDFDARGRITVNVSEHYPTRVDLFIPKH